MLHLMRSITYRFRKIGSFIPILYLMMILFSACMILLDILNSNTDGVSNSYSNMAIAQLAVILIMVCVITSRIYGPDYTDKLLYMEILSGKSRKQIFLARLLVALGINYLTIILICMAPIYLLRMLFPMGNAFTMAEIWGRVLLMIFPITKMTCEISMICVMAAKYTDAMSYALFVPLLLLEVLRQLIAPVSSFFSNFLSSYSLMELLNFITYSTYTIENLEPISIYSSDISLSLVVSMILVDIVISVVCCMLGYAYFRKDDLN